MNAKLAPKKTRRTTGFALLEVLSGLSFLAVGMLALGGATVSGTSAMIANEESTWAAREARKAINALETSDIAFEHLFATYTTGIEDPEPGETSVPQARTWTVGDTAKERTAEITIAFPTVSGDMIELREDRAQQDLNGDGEIDTEDHAHDYKLLPVTVTVTWKGRHGPRQLTVEILMVRS